ncbi:hypothetical protein OSB04_019780 [Centaurea solstitialis]|uniref:HAT C-terminal dimerisation domain-containing protein n=1 Tax=Centaurea solstitialis TaxID=347529 RepID=A0AA38W383_9ASTR|nr:hypothetical protein OSB04_019780 [Centaurea solstitialis]
MEYWKPVQGWYPIVSQMARDILAIRYQQLLLNRFSALEDGLMDDDDREDDNSAKIQSLQTQNVVFKLEYSDPFIKRIVFGFGTFNPFKFELDTNPARHDTFARSSHMSMIAEKITPF